MTPPATRTPVKRSLLWTLTGTFLLVLVVAGILQWLFVVTLFEPIMQRWNDDRSRAIARGIAAEIAALPADAPGTEIEKLIRAVPRDPGGARYFYVSHGKPTIGAGPVQRGYRRFLFTSGISTDSVAARPANSGDGMTPGFFGGAGDSAATDGTGRGRRGGFGGSRLVVVTRESVARSGGEQGELVAVAFRPRLPFWPGTMSRRLLAYIPVALLVAGVGGLILFRSLVKRLGSLERLADAVATGNLAARVVDGGGDEIGRLGVRLNEMTARLEEARERHEAEERVRRQLLGDISHELATPLTSIRAHAETLLNSDVDLSGEERRSYLTGILDESGRMNRLVDDLLDLSRLEAGVGLLESERLDWTELCRNGVARFTQRYAHANRRLEWMDAAGPAWVVADGRRLEQALDNLLSNGLRHVPEGERVEVTLTPGTVRHRLVVADSGPGLPEADRARVFDRFFRADASRSTAGTGLGLAIVREIARRHGGEVRAEAREPRGTAFVVELPVAPS